MTADARGPTLRAAGWVTAVIVLLVSLASGMPAVPAQEDENDDERATRLTLTSPTPWVAPGQSFDVWVDVETPQPDDEVELSVSVFRRVASRSEFVLTLDDRIRGSAIVTSPAALLSELTPGATGARLIRLPVHDPAVPAEPGRLQLRLRDDGVYPVRVEAREAGGGKVLARLTTHLVYAAPPAPEAPKLFAALVLPVHAPPALQPDGERELPATVRRRLAGMATALEARPQVPLTVVPTPETVQALAGDDADAVAALRRALPGRQVLGGTYVPVDDEAFTGSGATAELAHQAERGRRVLEDTLQVDLADDIALVDEPLDERRLQSLRARGVDRLLVPDGLLAPVQLSVTLTQPFELSTRDVRRPVAVAADPGLAAHFTAEGGAVLRAHRFLADLAVLAFDRPGRARGAVALAPASWRPSAEFLGTVLDALANAPMIAPVTVDAVFSDVPLATTGRGTTMQRSFRRSEEAEPATPLPAARIAEVRRKLQSFSSMLDSGNLRDDEFEEHLLASQSRDVRPRRRNAYLDGLERRLDRELGLVQVPAGRSVTLTARRGEIPVTVLSEAGYPVVVDVRVASDRLRFPEGATRRVELVRRNSTQQFSVEARGSGTFPLRVQLLSPDGSLVVAETRFTVRSTAFSGVGLVLSAGALVVLFAWWARHFARGRRNRRLVAS